MRKLNPKLTSEEKEILESVERGEWKSVPNVKEKIAYYQQVAANTLKKDARVNIRLSSLDLMSIKTKAMEEGIPYQTLMASILHKYAAGKLT